MCDIEIYDDDAAAAAVVFVDCNIFFVKLLQYFIR